MIRRLKSELIHQSLFNIQPISAPVGRIFYYLGDESCRLIVEDAQLVGEHAGCLLSVAEKEDGSMFVRVRLGDSNDSGSSVCLQTDGARLVPFPDHVILWYPIELCNSTQTKEKCRKCFFRAI